jgi:hypothetical protein
MGKVEGFIPALCISQALEWDTWEALTSTLADLASDATYSHTFVTHEVKTRTSTH